MKNKGFTLIELLAVIVILAIIAVIIIPIIGHTIEVATKGSAERSADNFINAVEKAVAKGELENNNMEDGTYVYDGNEYIVKSDNSSKKYLVAIKGSKPNSGSSLVLSKGRVIGLSSFILNGYEISYTNNKVSSQKFNPNYICTIADSANASDKYALGTEYQCKINSTDIQSFYVLGVDGNNVSLITNINPESWSGDGFSNSIYIEGWDLNAYIPTAQQLINTNIANNPDWTADGSTEGVLPGWLCINNDGNNYQTNTIEYDSGDGYTNYWYVYGDSDSCTLGYGEFDPYLQLHPVIVINKLEIN